MCCYNVQANDARTSEIANAKHAQAIASRSFMAVEQPPRTPEPTSTEALPVAMATVQTRSLSINLQAVWEILNINEHWVNQADKTWYIDEFGLSIKTIEDLSTEELEQLANCLKNLPSRKLLRLCGIEN